MKMLDSHMKGYLIAACVGAAGGALLALFTTKAFPKMMSQVMSNMMKNMMKNMISQRGGGSCTPEDM